MTCSAGVPGVSAVLAASDEIGSLGGLDGADGSDELAASGVEPLAAAVSSLLVFADEFSVGAAVLCSAVCAAVCAAVCDAVRVASLSVAAEAALGAVFSVPAGPVLAPAFVAVLAAGTAPVRLLARDKLISRLCVARPACTRLRLTAGSSALVPTGVSAAVDSLPRGISTGAVGMGERSVCIEAGGGIIFVGGCDVRAQKFAQVSAY